MRKLENNLDYWEYLDAALTFCFLSLFIKTSFCIMLDCCISVKWISSDGRFFFAERALTISSDTLVTPES